MQKHKHSQTALSALLVITSLTTVGFGCASDDEDKGPVPITLQFAPVVGEQDFQCGQTYAGVGAPGVTVEPIDFRFYVHNVRLLLKDNTEVPVTLEQSSWQNEGTALVDFENGAGFCTHGDAETNLVVSGTAPKGKYVGVKFSLGVPLEQNHRELTTLPAPLNKSSLSWNWALGHIFLSAVTRTLATIEGEPTVVEHFTHVGSIGCDGEPETGVPVTGCQKPNRAEYTLQPFDVETQRIAVDFSQLKFNNDVTIKPGCHSFTDNCAWSFDRLGINWHTGSLTPTTQTVFQVR